MRRGVSLEVADIIQKSISDSSLQQYNCYLKRWWNFCVNLNKDPFSEPPLSVIEFLHQEFERCVAHGTLGSIRSAISCYWSTHSTRRKYKTFFEWYV